MTIYLIVDLSCCPLACTPACMFWWLACWLAACMLACRLHVRLHVSLHVGLQALHVGCSPVAFVLSAYMLACMSACMLVVVMLSACMVLQLHVSCMHAYCSIHTCNMLQTCIHGMRCQYVSLVRFLLCIKSTTLFFLLSTMCASRR